MTEVSQLSIKAVRKPSPKKPRLKLYSNGVNIPTATTKKLICHTITLAIFIIYAQLIIENNKQLRISGVNST
jgi:hypothetical protein